MTEHRYDPAVHDATIDDVKNGGGKIQSTFHEAIDSCAASIISDVDMLITSAQTLKGLIEADSAKAKAEVDLLFASFKEGLTTTHTLHEQLSKLSEDFSSWTSKIRP